MILHLRHCHLLEGAVVSSMTFVREGSMYLHFPAEEHVRYVTGKRRQRDAAEEQT